MRKMPRVCAPLVAAILFVGLMSAIGGGAPATAATCPAPREGTQKGVAVLWRPAAVSSASAQRAQQIARYARAVGANSLSVSVLIYTSGMYGNRVYAGPNTPSLASLRQMLVAARAAGLRVALRPLIDETNIPRPQWRGTIRPSSPSAWFQSYGNQIVGLARLAASTCVDELAVGAELNSLQRYVGAWSTVANRVRAAGYRGDLTYSANWNAPVTYRFGKRPGVDFYPHLNLRLSATATQVTAAMVQAMNRFPAGFRTHMVVQETGFPARGGVYTNPSWWGSGKTTTTSQQATWFTSACRASMRTHAAGIYFWIVDSATNPFAPTAAGEGVFGFQRRSAESAVRSCFAQRW